MGDNGLLCSSGHRFVLGVPARFPTVRPTHTPIMSPSEHLSACRPLDPAVLFGLVPLLIIDEQLRNYESRSTEWYTPPPNYLWFLAYQFQRLGSCRPKRREVMPQRNIFTGRDVTRLPKCAIRTRLNQRSRWGCVRVLPGRPV